MNLTATSNELKDSKDLLGDWRALRDRIATDGYVFLRGLLDPTMIDAVGRTGLGHLQRAGWTEPGQDPITAAPRMPVRAVRMRDGFGDAGYRQILAVPGFNMIPFTSPLAALMGQILGPAGFCYPLKLPRIGVPRLGGPPVAGQRIAPGLPVGTGHVHLLGPPG